MHGAASAIQDFSQASLQRPVGRSYMTLSCTQNRILSNQSGSSTPMEACVTIQCWHRHLDLESVSALRDTLSMIRCSLSSHPYCLFSISQGERIAHPMSTHI